MLATKNRLTKEKDFKRINRLSRPFFSFYFRLKYLANNLGLNRFAVVVTTKISKKATERNKIKRQIREIIRSNQGQIKPGHDVIISAQAKALNKDYQDLEKNLLSLLNKAKLLK